MKLFNGDCIEILDTLEKREKYKDEQWSRKQGVYVELAKFKAPQNVMGMLALLFHF